jgi:hypothetical protein
MIPDVKAGDSVWWHSDMIRSVAPVQNQKGRGKLNAAGRRGLGLA